MKQILLKFQMLVLAVFLTATISAQVVSTTDQTLTACDVGNTILVPINSQDITSTYGNIVIFTIGVEFDLNVLTYTGYTNLNPSFPGLIISVNPDGSTGLVQFNVEESTFTGFPFPDGKMFDIEFTYDGGDTDLDIVTAEFLGDDFVSYYPPVTNGSITFDVYPVFVVGSISDDQSICSNTIPDELIGVAPTGGVTPYSYQWESSTDGTTFENIVGEIGLNYQPPALIASTYYQLVQASASGCDTLTTNMVTISVQQPPTAYAGADDDICEDASYILSGSATNQQSVTWTTAGDGTFVNANSLTATYTPGTNDISTGSAVLTLTAYAVSPCSTDATADMTLTIQENPTANAGADADICEDDAYTLSGAATNQQSVTWTTAGDGTFVNANSLTATYNPGINDISTGSAVLTLTAYAVTPCSTDATADMTLTIQGAPTADAGADAIICDATYTLSGAATNQGSVNWTTAGDGTFDNPALLAATYTPGSNDISTGSAVLTLTASAVTPCSTDATDDMTLTIQGAPTVDAGADASICADTYTLSGMATGQGSVSWTTNGDGTFDNPALLAATYTPGANDISTGSAVLTLTAYAAMPCTVSVSDFMVLTVNPVPTAFAGADADIPLTVASYTIADATATNYASLEWTSAGDGLFDDVYALNPTYTPGLNDIANGSVILTLKAFGNGICPDVTDDMTLTIYDPSGPLVSTTDQTLSACDIGNTILVPINSQDITITYDSIVIFTIGVEFDENVLTYTGYTNLNPSFPALDIAVNPDGSAGLVQFNIEDLAFVGFPFPDGKMFDIEFTYEGGDTDLDIVTAEFLSVDFNTYNAPVVNGSITFAVYPVFVVGSISADQSICSNTIPNELIGVAPTGGITPYTYQWESSTDGITFTNVDGAIALNYQPDALIESTYYQLVQTSGSGCDALTTNMVTISVQQPPTANAGADAEICEDFYYTLSGVATNQQSVSWTTSGDGTFDDPSLLAATYTPGTNDISTGSAVLTLTAYAIAPCSMDAIDDMTLSVQELPTADAGADAEICEDFYYTLSGVATNQQSVSWTTAGDGTFDDPSLLTATYTPGNGDIGAGSAILTLTAYAVTPCSMDATDDMTLNIQELPTANAGPDAEICEGFVYTLSGVATNQQSVSWTTGGDGTFDDPSLLAATYTPGVGDLSAGSAVLTLTAYAITPCGTDASDMMTLSIQYLPTADAGADAEICEDATYTLSGMATNQQSVMWTTAGDGTFDDPTLLAATYTPGIADLSSGSAILTMTAYAIAPCGTDATDDMTLSIQYLPTADAGADAEVCEGFVYTLSGVATNQQSVSWTTGGDGTFDDPSLLAATYTPGIGDISAGSAVLTLTAYAITPCGTDASDMMTLSIQYLPTADAGADAEICEDATYTLSGVATNQQSVMWTTAGDGTFDDPTLLTATYTPGIADISSGSAILTMTAYAIAPCGTDATDDMTLSIQYLPTADAGADAEICEGFVYILSGVATNQQSVSWTTAGDGTFDDPALLTATYTPGIGDISAGSAVLTLTAYAITPCGTDASDMMTLSIQYLPTADAGADAEICEDVTYTLSGVATNQQSVMWTTAGDGTFDDPTLLAATYTPGIADISSGSTLLTLTAYAIAPCGVDATDDMTLTIQPAPTADAGADAEICEDVTYTLSGVATNQQSVMWTTAGDGTFDDPTMLAATYTPGVNDISAGSAVLTLTAYAIAPCSMDAIDDMTLSIQELPTADAGADAEICEDFAYTLSGVATNQQSVSWTTAGDGTFDDASLLAATYTPGAGDISSGSAVLTLTAYAIAPCGVDATDDMTLTIQLAPTADAGADAEICEGFDYTLSGVATNQQSVSWTTAGDGTFDDASLLAATYTPGAGDISAGSAVLTLTAYAIAPCEVDATDDMTLTIQLAPTADAGPDAEICETGLYLLADATAADYSSIAWTTSGDGSFDDATIVNPVYTPGVGDISLGSAVLTLTAYAITPCVTDASDAMTLTIQQLPTADAGADAEICETDILYLLADATATDYDLVEWTTSGDGTFNDATIVNPEYTPGIGDINLGSAVLTLTAYAVTPCLIDATDEMTLTIQSPPTADAGMDAEICEDATYTLSGVATNQQSVLWTTAGDGTFDDPTLLAATYTPGTADISLGSAVLTLTASAVSPCSIDATDDMTLTIQLAPTADAGADAEICEDVTYTLSGMATNQQSVLWTTAGDGTFDDPALLAATYTPGAGDISSGSAVLTLTAYAVTPCTADATDDMTLTIQPAPTADAGADAEICEDVTYTLSGVATNQQSVSWTTSGDGTFDDPALLAATYTPGTADISSGSAVLTLTAYAVSPCSIDATDDMTLTIQLMPTADAGADAEICEDFAYTLSGAATNQQSVSWTTSGDGTFDDPTLLAATYTPGTADIGLGSAILTLTAYGNAACGDAMDDMTLTIQGAPTADAGLDAEICEDFAYTLSGVATNQQSVSWTTSGDGTFDDPTLLAATYTPGMGDLSSGSAVLTLTAYAVAPCETDASDAMTLSIQGLPTADAGEDATICEDFAYTLSGVATNQQSVSWTTSGDGTFDDPTLLAATYTPGMGDLSSGSAVLTLTAYAVSPCLIDATDDMTLTIQLLPTADAGADAEICENFTYTLSGVATNQQSVSWTTSGDGTFDDPNLLTATYTPGAGDIGSGSAVLTLTAYGYGYCPDAMDDMTLTITPQATAYAGLDAEICETGLYSLVDATATNYSSVMWTTTGTGTFTDPNIVNPVYTPSQNDIDDGFVILTLTSYANGSCVDAIDDMTLTITRQAIASAGDDAEMCETAILYLLADATADYYSSIAWTTSGDGTFNDATIVNPEYTPGTNDIAGGTVVLTITAYGSGSCTDAMDDMTLTITPQATAYAGPDAEICETGTYYLVDATATNYSGLMWSTSGTGSFTDPTNLNPGYTPSQNDIDDGFVILTLTAYANGSCIDAMDDMTLTITSEAEAYAGVDAEICETAIFYMLADATAANYDSIGWTSNGDGTFNDATILNPEYTPGAGDIAGGSVVLTITAYASGSCLDAVDDMILTIQSSPTADAGADAEICEDATYTLSGVAANQLSVMWTTAGDGTFDDPTLLAATYTPGTVDLGAGSVVLTLTAYAVAPCGTDASDAMTLSFQDLPTADAGADAEICENSTYTLSGMATNQQSVMWTTDGDGTFDDPTLLAATYTPGIGDKNTGSAVLTLTAYALTPCGIDATDDMTLTLTALPTANAGADAVICEGETYTLSGVATNQQSVEWATSGDGTFDNANSLTATYTPGTNDISNGSAVLTLTAYAVSPCTTTATDNMTLTINQAPTANAGDDGSVCEGETYMLSGEASNQQSVEWTTSGDGTFDDPTLLEATYTPGTGDVSTGSAVLTLTAFAITPCTQSVSDIMELTINPLPGIPDTPDGPTEVITSATPQSEYTTNTVPNADEYQWMVSPANAGTFSGTSTTGTITWDPSFIGDVYITVLAINDCGETSSDSLLVHVNTIGYSDLNVNDISVTIAPNPNQGIFKIIISGLEDDIKLAIIDGAGQIVLMDELINTNYSVYTKEYDLGNVPKGMYYIKLYNAKVLKIEKMIIF